MGWTGIHADLSKSNRQIISEEFGEWENEKIKVEILDSAQLGNVVYTAHKTTNKETGKGTTWAGIFLVERNSRNYFNFSYKDMDETYGPYECSCPKRILDKLSPTENECANIWRKACRNKIAENKRIKKNIKQLKNLPLGTKVKVKGNRSTVCEHLIYNGKEIYKVTNEYLRYSFKNIAIHGFEIL